MKTRAAAYLGTDKENEARQRLAIKAFAKQERLAIAAENWFLDLDGAAPIGTRSGFKHLLARIDAGDVRVVVVENVEAFASDLVGQELGIVLLIRRGARILTAAGEDLIVSDDPVKKLMRGVAGIFAQLDASTRQEKGRGR